jgi:hypothetical protein
LYLSEKIHKPLKAGNPFVYYGKKEVKEILEKRGFTFNSPIYFFGEGEEFMNHLYITKGYFVQLFGLENFLFNINRHNFVPKHRILSKSELQDVLNKYSNITLNKKNISTLSNLKWILKLVFR